MDSKNANQFAELLKEQLGNPVTRAQLDLNLWLANHLDVAAPEMCAILGTAFMSYVKLVCIEGKEEEMIAEINEWARHIVGVGVSEDSEELEVKLNKLLN